MAIYIDPTRPTNGAGTFADPRNTWVGVTWTEGETYLQRDGTVFAGSASISPAQNAITLGTYDGATGAQITDNTRHATIANTAGNGINTNNRTGIVIDNLQIIGANAANSNAVQALYTTSDTALSLTIRRCILQAQGAGTAAIRARGDGLTVTDTVASSTATAAAFALTCKNVTLQRCNVSHIAGSAITIATTADSVSDPVNALVEDCVVNSTGGGSSAGDGVFIKGRGVTIRGLVSTSAYDNSILVSGQSILIENCEVSGFDLQRSAGDGIQITGTHDLIGCVIKQNKVIGHRSNPVKQAIIVCDSGSASQSGAVYIARNECRGMATGMIISTPGASIIGNDVRDCTGAGVAIQGSSTVMNGNRVLNTGGAGVFVSDGLTGVKIVGNTIVDHGGSGINLGTATAVVQNNITVRASGNTASAIIEESGTSTLDRNVYHNRDGALSWEWDDVVRSTFAAWKTASSQDANSFESDPQLGPDYSIPSTSPCKGAGVYIPGVKHFGGHSMSVVSPDIGARRYFADRAVTAR